MNKISTVLTIHDSEGDAFVFTASKRDGEDGESDEPLELVISLNDGEEPHVVFCTESDLRELVDLLDVAIGY